MFFLRRRLRPLTWVAIVAMLGLGLLPGLSHALAWAGGSGEGAGWAEVCTTRGQARVAADGGPADLGSLPAAAAMEHCPYCVPGTPAAGLPPAPAPSWRVPDIASAAAPAARPLPALAAPWTSARPRAPPARR